MVHFKLSIESLNFRLHFLVCFILYFFFICGCSVNQTTDLHKEINILIDNSSEWGLAAQHKDIEKLMHHFHLDAVSVNKNIYIVTGKDSIRNWIEKMFKDTCNIFESYGGKIEEIQISSSADLAYIRGIDWITRITDYGYVQERGNFIDIWRKIDDRWQCIVTMGDMDMKSINSKLE